MVFVGDPEDTDTDSIPESIPSIKPPSIKKPPPKYSDKFGANVTFSLGDEDLDALNDDCKYLRHCICGLQTVTVPVNNKGVFR